MKRYSNPALVLHVALVAAFVAVAGCGTLCAAPPTLTLPAEVKGQPADFVVVPKRSFNNCPCFSFDNISNAAFSDSIFLCESSVGTTFPVFFANTTRRGFCQFGESVALASGSSFPGNMVSFGCPAFLISIFCIVLCRAQEQMVRINAGWIVAMMAYAQAYRYRSIVDFPGQPMRPFGPSFRVDATQYSVPIVALASHPSPAVAWVVFVNLWPKQIFPRWKWTR